MVASAVAEGLQARAGVGGDGDKPEAEGAEPLAEWEQELLAGAHRDRRQPEPPSRGTPEADVRPNRSPTTTERLTWRTTPLPMSSDFGS